MNIKSQSPTIRSYGTPSIFNGVNLWFIKNGFWYFKSYDPENPDRNKGPAVTGDFTPDYSAKLFPSNNDFQKNLELLNERINTIHKELSYWDLYKITDSVLSSESFPAIISGLAVGSSAVINCETFTYMETQYHRGDVIVKISDNNELLIPAINTGVFKPDDIQYDEDSGGYRLSFTFMPSVPKNQETVTLPSLTIEEDGNAVYGQSFEFQSPNTEHVKVELFNESTIIKPVVKTFVNSQDIGLEEIILDNDFCISFDDSETPNRWELSLLEKPAAFDTIIIQVK